MTTQTTKKIREGFEPIPGYVLEEVIGRGGFGEVWRASAPGGLKKAVKFVFGTQDQTRAARELKSLERIKGVQHPFLLTLERFEAIDDQLVIVTELADGSLEELHDEHRERGSCGIPRDALIGHLHDAADALDYLHKRYQLQHLDIKPGNLLMVGGHVKVADFGLLKDLRDVDCSIVGGLTPIYAPPEIFDGRPSLNSDQYSLAVMYQEMLTGVRPFSGRTIAQLATQHLHNAPNLDPLPPADRPVVARALEKNPDRRFPSCIAFVDALRSSRKRRVESIQQEMPQPQESAAVVGDLPQLTTDGSAVSKDTHAMVVALGGTGAECLQELRRRVAEDHLASDLDFHCALIDTDMATGHAMRLGEVSDRVPVCQSIHTPLRSAHEYRQSDTARLSTISRRWIYNVPRSGTTEGMRPLGRLALVDHGAAVMNGLAQSIRRLAEASQDGDATVYVVGSITGGTCSGMFIDVVHLLRHLLDEAGMVETQILSLLTTAPMQGNPVHPLALHDAQAALSEIQHFLKPGNGYPGDPGAGWPSVPAARTPLRDVYLVAGSLHQDLTPASVDTISDYIWADMTGCGELLDSARKLQVTEDNAIQPASVRSVGVVRLGDPHHSERKLLAPGLVKSLLIKWLGLPAKAREAAPALESRLTRRVDFYDSADLDPMHLLAEHAEAFDTVIDSLGEPSLKDGGVAVAAMVSAADKMVATGSLPSNASAAIRNLQREAAVMLIDGRTDVTTMIECLKLIQKECDRRVVRLRDGEHCSAEEEIVTPETGEEACEVPADNEDPEDSRVSMIHRAVSCCYLQRMSVGLRVLIERLDLAATTFAMAVVETNKLQSTKTDPWDELPEEASSQLPKIRLRLHRLTSNQYLAATLNERFSGVDAAGMIEQLIEEAIPLVAPVIEAASTRKADADANAETRSTTQTGFRPRESHTQTAVTQAIQFARDEGREAAPLSIEDAVVGVRPALLKLGGLQRLLLVLGSEHERGQFEPQVRDACEIPVSVAVVPGSTPKLIHEAQQIELTQLLSRLTVLNGGNKQVTGKLSSRTDIDW